MIGLALFAPRAEAADWYVATNAAHTFNGAAWDTAFTHIQDALNASAGNDTIYVAGHTFGLTTQLVWTTAYVTVRGGYAATNAADRPGPNDPTRWPTVIARSGTALHRLLRITGAHNGRLEDVTLRGGHVDWEASAVQIEGNSQNVVLSGCIVESNTCAIAATSDRPAAAIQALAHTSLTITHCIVRNNTGWVAYMGTAGSPLGGGIYALGTLSVVDSRFVNNLIHAGYNAGYGAGIYFNGTSLTLRNVLLAGNEGRAYDSTPGVGGVHIAGGAADIHNVTVADNIGGVGLQRAGGTVAVQDSILWGNGVDSTGGVTLAWSCYSNSTDHVDGGNNLTQNPMFVDTTYYHLQSQGENYVGGYFDGGTWAVSSSHSPCIDAGDPASDFAREPAPNGNRVNLGCYGNTPAASKMRPANRQFTIR